MRLLGDSVGSRDALVTARGVGYARSGCGTACAGIASCNYLPFVRHTTLRAVAPIPLRTPTAAFVAVSRRVAGTAAGRTKAARGVARPVI
jgi:hypothetical protein